MTFRGRHLFHGFSREQVAHNQYERLIAGFAAARELVPALERGRGERDGERELPATTEDSTIGALVSLAARKVAAGEAERLEDLLPDFTEFILSPYLGPAEAARLARTDRVGASVPARPPLGTRRNGRFLLGTVP